MLEAATPALSEMAGENTLLISILAGKTIGDLAPFAARAGYRARHAQHARRDRTGRHRRLRQCRRQRRAARYRSRAVVGLSARSNGWRAKPDRRRDGGFGIGAGLCLPSGRSSGAGRRCCGLPADLAFGWRAARSRAPANCCIAAPNCPPKLAQNATSPGGTTQAALEVLMASEGLAALMARAVAAAAKRAGELSG